MNRNDMLPSLLRGQIEPAGAADKWTHKQIRDAGEAACAGLSVTTSNSTPLKVKNAPVDIRFPTLYFDLGYEVKIRNSLLRLLE